MGPGRQPHLDHRRRPRPGAAAGRTARRRARAGRRPPGPLRRLGPRVVGPRRSRTPAHGGVRRRRRARAAARRRARAPDVRAVVGRADVRRCGRGRPASTCTSSSTGTTSEHLLSLAVPLDVRADDGDRAASSSAPCAGRPTRRRRGTRPSSRCAPTATSTSPSRRSASPCSTTGATATPCSTAPCASAWPAAARFPDPDADQGRHEVTVSLFPHGPGLADVVAEAERLDLPVRVVDGGTAAGLPSRVVTVTGDRRRGRRRQARRRRLG